MKLLKLLVLSALLAFTANSAKAGVPDGIWTIPEPQGLEFTTFTVDVNNPSEHHYYLYNPATKMFFSSGNGWYTQASLRTFGMEIWLQSATEYDAPEGSYELWDNNCNNPARYTGEGNMFTDGTDGTWVDHASQDYYSWSYEIVGDCVRFQNVALIADRPEYTGKYLGFDGTFVTVGNTESDVRHLDAWTAILRHVDPSAPGASVDWKAVTPESYQAFVGSAGYQAYVDGVEAYIAAMNLKVTIEEAEALYIDVTAALAVYTNTESMPDQLKEAASDLQQLIDAKKKLKESIEYYESNGFTDTAAAKAVLTNPQATVEEIEQAKADLDAAFVAWGTTNASVETPADMTGKITNPNFDGASSLGWLGTVPNMTGSGTHGPANVAEHWNKTFDTYQDIEGLPAGVYQLTAETSWRGTWEDLQNGVTGSKVYVMEGDTEYSVPFNNIFKPRNTESLAGPTSFGTWANELTEYQDGITYYYPDDPSCFRVYADKGWYDTKMTFAKLEEGSLRLGVALPQGVSSDNWSCFDTFTLKYFGNDVDAVKLFASEAWPFQPIQLDKNEVLFTEQYLAAYNDSVDAYNPDEVTSIAYFLEKKAAVQAVYDALQANIDLWQQWNQAVDDANYRATDLGWTEPWNMEGGMSDYLNDVENIMMACELTNEQLEEEIAKIQAMIAECEDYVTNHLSIEIPTDGLVAYYPFNGNANDVSGHGNNGTPMDNVTLTTGVHGEANGAYQFGGTDNPGHIHIPNSESLVINDGWSFATYIKPTSYNGMNGWGEPDQYGGHAIMGKSHDQHGFSIQYEITEETLRTKIGHWGDEWEADATVSGKFLNHWTHIAYTYSSNSGFCVYINGEMVCRSDKTPDFSVANTQDYYLGKYNDFWYPMNGIMDEVAIYKRALTADEVRQMAQYAEDEGAAIPDEAIDLGLPSGTKWSPWNVGASKPEDYGGYYAWGETEEKDVYDWSTYKWCNGSYDSQTKYCTNSDYGTVDNKTTLDPEDDVAHVKWGGAWKMPTLDQVQELLDNCTSEWTTQNGVEGRKFTGSNGNSIFLPAAGRRWDGVLGFAGSYSYYWSSTLGESYPGDASELDFSSGHAAYWYDSGRFYGQSVRPVYVESTALDIAIDATNFPDENFRNWVLAQDYGQDSVLTQEEIAGITEMNVSYKEISDLTGIKYFTSLTYLDCGNNHLTSLDLSGCTTLTGLSCYINWMTSLDVSGCTSLTNLNCYDNELISIDVTGCTALIWIQCNLNEIRGEMMDALVSSLPTVERGDLYALYPSEWGDGNECTPAQVAVANAKGWKIYRMDDSTYAWVELEVLEPVAEGEQDFGEGGDITEETDLNGVVVDNMFYNIGTDAGGYNSEEGCIVITQETSDEQMELLQGLGISDEELQQNFTGIIFKVPAGKGTVTVTAETTGSMTLKVKVGNGQAVEMELSGKLKITFPYDVSEESLVYIYAGTTGVSGVRRSAEESSLKIYGIEWTSTSMPGDADGDGTIDVNDITCVAAHILGRNPANFNAAAADADGDGTIDVNDITVIAGMILNAGK